jgi:hypothetical protein
VPTRALVRVAVMSVLLVAARPLSPAFLVAIVAVAVWFAAERGTLLRLWADGRVRVLTVVVGIGVALSTAFVVANDSLQQVIVFAHAPADSRLDLARAALAHSGDRAEQAVGVFGWTGFGAVQLPYAVVVGWIVAFLAVNVLAVVVGHWRARTALAFTTLVCLGLPALAQLIGREGAGWQGRYVLPLAVGVPIMGAYAIERSGRVPRPVERIAVVVACVAAAAALFVAHQTLMTRNLVGVPNHLFEGLTQATWNGPLNPPVLFGWSFVAAAVYGGWLIALASSAARTSASPAFEGARSVLA